MDSFGPFATILIATVITFNIGCFTQELIDKKQLIEACQKTNVVMVKDHVIDCQVREETK